MSREYVDMRVGCVHVTIGSGLYEGGLCVAPLVCVWVSFLALLTSLLGSQLSSEVLREPWAIFEARIVLLPGLLSLCSYTTQDHISKAGTSHSGLGPPSSLTNQEHAAQIC